MSRTLLVTTFLGAAILSYGQTEKPELVTDRPDQTEAAMPVPQGGLQVESGFSYEKDRQDDVVVTNFAYNKMLIKYGVNDHFELRLITGFVGKQATVAEHPGSRVQGFSPLALGVKVKLAEEKGFWPQAAFIGHINLRTGSKDLNPSYTAADFRFTFAHTVSEKFALSYNLGAEWNGETPDAAFLYTLALRYAATNRVGLFVESYAFYPEKDKADNRFDCGLTYMITSMVQWDVSGGLGLSRSAPDYFLSTGVSFRVLR